MLADHSLRSRCPAADQVSYEDLYARWEQGHWRASEIDFSVDREDWQQKFTELERRAALWTYSMFLHGEDAVANALSPYIDAAPRQEQKYFLATQQVDEARHAVLFGRFMREVAGTGENLPAALEATLPELTWGFRKVFARLDRMAGELRRDRSKPKLAQAIALYHLVIEATLAQAGQHFIEESLTRRSLLPGLREGIGNVSRDEQRHIAFGVKMIADLVREDPDCEAAIEELLREILPFATAVFVPPDWDERYVTCFGFTLEQLYAYGAEAIEGRLRAAGIEPLQLRVGLPFDFSPVERAERGLTLLRAGYLGGPGGHVEPDPQATAMLFDGLRRQLDPAIAPGARIQWEFTDAEPWHLRIDNGETSVAAGRLEHPDLVFRCRFDDWLDLAAGRIDPLRALLLGRIRPSGSLRMLARARKLFA
ncbi:MAG: sterol-binding protein [Solirubrobacterales bacterium]|nr:MAG: sterol-binding protein [Solirubrobacterales bacterium]PZS10037.1 MAG: sterol-binding protein [Solirubrobacterales bacterium]